MQEMESVQTNLCQVFISLIKGKQVNREFLELKGVRGVGKAAISLIGRWRSGGFIDLTLEKILSEVNTPYDDSSPVPASGADLY